MKTMTRFRYSISRILLLSILVLITQAVAAPVHAGGTVENCDNDSAFSSVLVGGGTVTFDCGGNQQTATILLSSTKTISANTVIDGGGKVTLSGGYGLRLFVVNNGVTLTLQNITLIAGYNPNSDGGAGVLNKGHLIVNHVTMQTGTDSAFNGGAISTIGALDISNSTFQNNKATSGGAIYANGANAVVSITDTKFQNNAATGKSYSVNGFGGAIYAANGASIAITAGDIFSNTASAGGGIAVSASGSYVSMNQALVRENYAPGEGGGLYSAGAATIDLSTFTKNIGGLSGAINNRSGALTVTDSTFSENKELNAGYGGAGINNYAGAATLTNVTLNNNTAGGGGAGFENSFGATASLTNVTFSGNTAGNTGGQGGGFHNYQASANLTNVTFYGNAAPSNTAGAIYNSNHATSHLDLTNVIVANSPSGGNCDFQKSPDTSDHNLSSDASCNFGAGRDSVKIKLGPLETNGGFTLTHRLLPGSAAIDNGLSVNVPKDQREITRPQNGVYDVGAVEFAPCDTPSKPELWFPASGAQLTTQVVTLDWIGPDCAKTFSVIVRQGSKTGAIVFSKTNIKPTQVKTTALAKNQTYFWQVTACKGAQCTAGKWSKFRVK